MSAGISPSTLIFIFVGCGGYGTTRDGFFCAIAWMLFEIIAGNYHFGTKVVPFGTNCPPCGMEAAVFLPWQGHLEVRGLVPLLRTQTRLQRERLVGRLKRLRVIL